MKLIPPQVAATEEAEKPRNQVKAKLNALELLNSTGADFADALKRAVTRVIKQDKVTSALALMAFLRGGISMLQSISRADEFNIDAQDVQEGNDGHTTGNRTAGRRTGTARRGRPRKIGSGTANVDATVNADGTPIKRGRGRPKGSKNKKTLAREVHQRALESAAAERKQRNVQARKRRVVKRKAKTLNKSVVGKPGNSRNRRGSSRRKGATKKVHRVR